MIIFFRGKAATGKSLVAKNISKAKDFQVLSKDIIFDRLLSDGLKLDHANAIAYDKLAEAIQEHHDKKSDIIVDIGLAHTPFFETFLSKMNLDMINVRQFLFICSKDDVWEERIAKRIAQPEAPNQMFKTLDEAKSHYGRYLTYKVTGEIEIDSALPIEAMINRIYEVI